MTQAWEDEDGWLKDNPPTTTTCAGKHGALAFGERIWMFKDWNIHVTSGPSSSHFFGNQIHTMTQTCWTAVVSMGCIQAHLIAETVMPAGPLMQFRGPSGIGKDFTFVGEVRFRGYMIVGDTARVLLEGSGALRLETSPEEEDGE